MVQRRREKFHRGSAGGVDVVGWITEDARLCADSSRLVRTFFPRIGLVLWRIFGSRVDDAFSSWIWPLLGLVFLPWTTLGEVFMWSADGGVSGAEWIFVGLGGCARRPLVPLAPGEGDVRRPLRIESLRRTHPCSSCVNWRRFLKPGIGVAVVLLGFPFVLPKLADYREVWSELKDLDAAALALLAAVTALNLATFSRPRSMAALPGIGFFRAHSESPRRRQHPRTSPPEVPRWGWE